MRVDKMRWSSGRGKKRTSEGVLPLFGSLKQRAKSSGWGENKNKNRKEGEKKDFRIERGIKKKHPT